MGLSSSKANASARTINSLNTILSLSGRTEAITGGAISETKSKLIRAVGQALISTGLIKAKDANLSDDELVAKVAEIAGKDGQSLKGPHQKKVCDLIAKAINDYAGAEVIDLSLPVTAVAAKIGEFIASARSDLGKEVLQSQRDLQTIIRNMDFISDLFVTVGEKIAAMPAAKADLSHMLGSMDKIATEMKRQVSLLRSILDVEFSKLDILAVDDSNLKNLVRRLGDATAGSNPFGVDVIRLLVAIGDYTRVTKMVKDALDKTGLSLKQLESAKADPKVLEEAYAEKVAEHVSKGTNLSPEDAAKAEKALAVLKAIVPNLYNEELVASFAKGANEEDVGTEPADVLGGAKLDKRIERRDALAKTLERTFDTNFARITKAVMLSAKTISDDVIHDRLKIDENLDKLIDALLALPELTDSNANERLSGRNRGIISEQERSAFVERCRYIISLLDKIAKDGKSEGPRDMKKYFESLMNLVIDYADKFNEGLGTIEPKFATSEYVEGSASGGGFYSTLTKHAGKAAAAATAVGDAIATTMAARDKAAASLPMKGADEDNVVDEVDEVDGAAEGSMRSRVAINLREFKESIIYFFRLAKVKASMKKIGHEMENYAEGYERMLGDAVAAKIDEILGKKQAMLDEIVKAEGDPSSTWWNGGVDKAVGTAQLGVLKKFVNDYHDAYIAMYQTAEAVDAILMNYTQQLVLNVQNLDDILKILQDVEIITTWMSDVDKLENLMDYYTNDGTAIDWIHTVSPSKAAGVRTAVDSLPVFDTVLAQWGALKNIVSAFASVGSKFGSKDVMKDSFMPALQIYKNLINFIKYSSIDLTSGAAPAIAAKGIPHLSCAAATLHTGWNGPERTMFKHIIQAIAGKILTTIEAYNMFTHVNIDHSLGYKSGLRFILGGADEAGVKVIPEAMELYVRLVLLAEFYRDLFNFEDGVDSINLLPETTGLFSRLIYIVFVKCKIVKEGQYSTEDTLALISAINKIWLSFQGTNRTNDIMAEFVADINRRIGIYTQAEKKRYIDDRDSKYNRRGPTGSVGEIPTADLELAALSDEGPRGPPPSSKFVTGRSGKTTVAAAGVHKSEIRDGDFGMIAKLRNDITDMFSKQLDKASTSLDNVSKVTSFKRMLYSKAEELKHSTSDADKLAIVANAITSLNRFNLSNLDKSLLAFHEVVVAPLYAAYKLFRTVLRDVNNITSPMFLTHLASLLTTLCDKHAGLFELKVDTLPGKISMMIDSAAFKQLEMEMLSNIKAQIEKFRGLIPDEVLNNYVKQNPTHVTLFDLEECCRVYIRGEMTSDERARGYVVLDDLINEKIKDITISEAKFNACGLGYVMRFLNTPAAYDKAFKELCDAINIAPAVPAGIIAKFDKPASAFNSILMIYLDLIYDNATGKVYAKYLEPLVGGILNAAVFKGIGVISDDTNITPADGRIVLKTIAELIKKLYTEKKKEKLAWVEADINLMPSFYKERLQINAPYLSEMIRRQIQVLEIYTSLVSAHTAVPADTAKIVSIVNSMLETLRNLHSMTRSMVKDVGELSDYLELQAGFSTDYKETNGREPFKPPSTMLFPLFTKIVAGDVTGGGMEYEEYRGLFRRNVQLGTYESKLKRGLAPLLQSKAAFDVTRVLDAHNKSTDSVHNIDSKQVAALISGMHRVVRFHLLAPLAGLIDHAVPRGLITYQSDLNVMNVVRITESSEQKSVKSAIIAKVGLGTATDFGGPDTTRASIRIYNIVDSCINPIDFNALARDFAMIHIYNFSLVFAGYALSICEERGEPATTVNRDDALLVSIDFGAASLATLAAPSVLTSMHTPKYISKIARQMSKKLTVFETLSPIIPLVSITQIHRILRLGVFNSLMFYNQQIVGQIPIASPKITELNERSHEIDSAKAAVGMARIPPVLPHVPGALPAPLAVPGGIPLPAPPGR